MATLSIKYRLQGKALPPRPLRASAQVDAHRAADANAAPRTAGTWQCPVFVEGSSHGVELLYPYDTACDVVNDGGQIRFVWASDGVAADGGDAESFALSKANPERTYLFNTMLDLQAPDGYVLGIEPRPRCLADAGGTHPTALYGHVETEW